MSYGSLALLVFVEGVAVGVAFGIRTRRFVPPSALVAVACICAALFGVPVVTAMLAQFVNDRLGAGDALLVTHLPAWAAIFALLALGVRGLGRAGTAN